MNSNRTVKLGSESKKFMQTINDLHNSGINYSLLDNYPDLPICYEGNDIDILVDCVKKAINTFHKNEWLVQLGMNYNPARAFSFDKTNSKWIIIELWQVKITEPKILASYIIQNKVISTNGLYTLPMEGLLAWKISKYFIQGSIRNKKQIEILANKWKQSNESIKSKALNLIKNCNVEKRTLDNLQLYLENWDAETITEMIMKSKEKAKDKTNKRLVYDGNINIKALLKRPKIILRLIIAKFKVSKYPLPLIAIVGNDGSGKTVFCNTIKRSLLYKTDPIHVSLKRKDPALPIYRNIRPWLSKMSRSSMKRYSSLSLQDFIINILEFIPFWLLETGDFIDRYMRYKFYELWAKSGLGMVFFERYVTDRLRGEYPGPGYSLFPLEQFFPMPNFFIYLDVLPEESMKRKPEDGHELESMSEKRDNYHKLMQKISKIVWIEPDNTLEEVYSIACSSINAETLIIQQGNFYNKAKLKIADPKA